MKETFFPVSWQVIDSDNSGKISADEIKNILKKIGDSLIDDTAVEDIIRELDMDGDGQIDYDGKSGTIHALQNGDGRNWDGLFDWLS